MHRPERQRTGADSLGCEASISLKGDVIYYEDVMSGPVAFDFPEAEGGILELSPGCPDIRHVG